jgi:hypothetical protein
MRKYLHIYPDSLVSVYTGLCTGSYLLPTSLVKSKVKKVKAILVTGR